MCFYFDKVSYAWGPSCLTSPRHIGCACTRHQSLYTCHDFVHVASLERNISHMQELCNSNARHVRSKQAQSRHDKTLLLLKTKPCLAYGLQGVAIQMTPISQGRLQWREEVLRRSEHRPILTGCNMFKEQVFAPWAQHPVDLLDGRSNISDGAEDLEEQQESGHAVARRNVPGMGR